MGRSRDAFCRMELPSGAKQAAEKLRFSDKVAEIRPSGAKARAFPALFGTTEVVP
jgi:hypothetical protein